MAYDLNDLWGWVQRLVRRVERLESGANLENASITNGRLRIIAGTLRVDSGGRLEVVGTVQIDGATTVAGTFTVSGPWNLTGNGTITGNVTISGNLALTGSGKFTSENVRIEGGKIYVGAGANLIVIDGSTGRIIAGGMTIDPTVDGGTVTFSGGRRLSVGADAIGLLNGINAVTVTSSGVSVLGALRVPLSDVYFPGVSSGTVGDVTHWIGRGADGKLIAVPKSSGGPTGSGLLRWPFDLSTVTKEFDTTDPAYTPPGHRGIDFGIAAGTPIPAAGSGTVLAVGFDSERGYFVILNHGDHDGRILTTRYYHLIGPSPLAEGAAVAKSETVGSVGSTGMSTGPHLHFETRYDGAAENPRAVMAVYGE